MKHIYILLFLLAIGQYGISQNSKEQEIFKKKVLSQYDTYFEKVEFAQDGSLRLDARETYFSMSIELKTSTMKTILSEWNECLVTVRYQYKRELWKKGNTNDVNMLDNWDLNKPHFQQPEEQRTLQTTNVHPWFIYFGGNRWNTHL